MKAKILLWILMVLVTVYSASAAINLTNSMVHYYTFDTANSSNPGGNPTMTDWFKTANITSSTNTPTWNLTGQNLEAWDYERTNSEYSTINSNSAFSTQINTLCSWIKPESFADWQTITRYDDSRTNFQIQVGAAQKIRIVYSSNGAAGTLTGVGTLSSGDWHHACFVFDAADVGNEMKIYINGSLDNQGADAGALDKTQNENRLGTSTAAANFFDGLLDEMMLYSTAKNTTFIQKLYNETSAGNYTWIKGGAAPGPVPSITVNYSSPVYEETQTQHKILFEYYNITNSSLANLTYNGTVYNGVINWSNVSYVEFIVNLTVPFVYNNNTAMPFNWTYQIFYSNGSNLTNTTSSYNQYVLWNLTKYPRMNITVFAINGTQINTFELSNPERTLNTTTGEIYYWTNATKTLNISIDAPGYALDWALINFTSGSFGAYNFSLYTTNSIMFYFRDEETNNLVNNVSIELISDPFSNNYSTTNGTLYIDLLSPATYTMRYTGTDGGYFERFYYFTLTNRTFNNLTLYLLSNSTGSEVRATVYDENNFEVEDAYIKVLRYDLDSNSYKLVEIAKTNFEGQTNLHLVLNDEFYEFIIEFPFGTVNKITSPTYIYETSLTFQIVADSEVGERFYKSQDITYDLSFNNATNNFRLTYSDANNVVSKACLKVWKISATKKTPYNTSCLNSPSGTILLGVANTTGAVYNAQAFAYFSNPAYYLTGLTHAFEEVAIAGLYGLFLIFILTLIFAVGIGWWSKSLALILTPLPLMMGSILNIIDISIGMCISIEIICVIIAYWISRRT